MGDEGIPNQTGAIAASRWPVVAAMRPAKSRIVLRPSAGLQGSVRDAVPRADSGGWKPPRERRDPVELVLAANAGRLPDLVPIPPRPNDSHRPSPSFAALPRMAADGPHPSSGPGCRPAGTPTSGTSGLCHARAQPDLRHHLDETLPAPGNGMALSRQRGPGRALYPAQTERVGAAQAGAQSRFASVVPHCRRTLMAPAA